MSKKRNFVFFGLMTALLGGGAATASIFYDMAVVPKKKTQEEIDSDPIDREAIKWLRNSPDREDVYIDSIDEVIDMLAKKNVLEVSEGATIVDLTNEGIKAPCIVKKSDGSSIYASRDLAAILYRARTYDYDKSIYRKIENLDRELKYEFVSDEQEIRDEKTVSAI